MGMLRKITSKKVIIPAGILLLVVLIVGALELTNTTHVFHKAKPVAVVSGSSFNTKGQPKKKQSSQSNGQSNGGTSSASDNSKTGSSSAMLVTPFGNFVSNHRPNLSGSPAPNTISSVCNTAPGATCRIIFTKDGVIKSLPAQTTDASGSTYWNWKLQDAGITAGTWKIQAVADLNGQSKTANDTLDLVVAP